MTTRGEIWIGEEVVRRRVSGIPRLAALAAILMGVASVLFAGAALFARSLDADALGPCFGAVAIYGGVGVLRRRRVRRVVAVVACLLQVFRGSSWLVASWVIYGLLQRSGSLWTITQFPPWHRQCLFEMLLVGLSLIAVILLLLPETREACLLNLRWKWLSQGLCPRCTYDLKGNPSGICPECGTRLGLEDHSQAFAMRTPDSSMSRFVSVAGLSMALVVGGLVGVSVGITRVSTMRTAAGADIRIHWVEMGDDVGLRTVAPAGTTDYVHDIKEGGYGSVSPDVLDWTNDRKPERVVHKRTQYITSDIRLDDRSSIGAELLEAELWTVDVSFTLEDDPRVYSVSMDLRRSAELDLSALPAAKVFDADTRRQVMAPYVLEPGEYRLNIVLPDESRAE